MKLKNSIMPKMDGTGPEKDGPQSGRGCGKCVSESDQEVLKKLGTGMAKRRKTGGGKGEGKRLQSGLK